MPELELYGVKKKYLITGVWVSWTAIAVVSYARHYIESGRLGEISAIWLDFLLLFGCYSSWAILTPTIFRIEARFPLTRSEWKPRLAILLVLSVIVSCLAQQIRTMVEFGIERVFGVGRSTSGFFWHFSGLDLCFAEFFFWMLLCVGCAIRHFVQFHQQAQLATQLALEKSQLEASLRQAELDTLRMRLNPHFLFNTLQNISVLAQQNPKVASQMLTRLGDVLRGALRRNVSAETTVSDEMSLTRDYLSMEKMRFGDRLKISVDVGAGSDRALIPSFLLQPLAENAVIHGLRGVSHVGTIALTAMRQGDRLVLTVADNGRGLSPRVDCDGRSGGSRLGIGLSSTKERLDRMYPQDHEFVIHRLNEGGTEVRIAIPFRTSEDLEEDPGEGVLSEETSAVDC